MIKNTETIGVRKMILAIECPGYSDRNDGFARTHCSRNKYHSSRIRKTGKLERVKHGVKAIINWIY